MVEISEFNAIRFSENDITDFICPPYDVIAPDEKEKLKKMSPFNIVNIELPDLLGKKNKYEKAADLFRLWQSTGVLKRDKNSALYFYEQIFSDHGIQMSRNGFFAAMKLSDPNSYKSPVKLHEKTLINQKHDRFEFLETVKANISPIFCFFNDENFIIKNVFNKTCKKIPSAIARDGNGTFHKLWVVNDEYLIKTVKKCLFDKNVFIADGHHRYEIAWEYNKRKTKENACRCSLQEDHNYVLTYFCPVEDQYISIWPTHRIVDEPLELELNICKYFDVHSARDFQRLSKKDIQPIMIFKNGKYRVLTIKKYSLLKKNMPNNSRVYRNLAVNILHNVLMPTIDASEFIYTKNDREAILIAKKTGKIAIIVPSITIDSLKVISLNNEIMPQKSTYFYPKVAAGIVIRAI